MWIQFNIPRKVFFKNLSELIFKRGFSCSFSAYIFILGLHQSGFVWCTIENVFLISAGYPTWNELSSPGFCPFKKYSKVALTNISQQKHYLLKLDVIWIEVHLSNLQFPPVRLDRWQWCCVGCILPFWNIKIQKGHTKVTIAASLQRRKEFLSLIMLHCEQRIWVEILCFLVDALLQMHCVETVEEFLCVTH